MALDTGLQPVPNYLAAMQSGAGLGLALRKQDTAESEAAQNLALAYAHLSATQEAAKQRAQQLAAGNLLRQAHEQALLEHYTQMQQAEQDRTDRMAEAAAKRAQGTATIVEHPEVPGMQFLRNPSGAETPVVRPAKEKVIDPGESLRLQMEAQRMMPLRAGESADDPTYQSRTNFAGNVLAKLQGKSTQGSPFKEGQIVRNKKDGKRYRIVNGEPVELKE